MFCVGGRGVGVGTWDVWVFMHMRECLISHVHVDVKTFVCASGDLYPRLYVGLHPSCTILDDEVFC